MVCHVLNLIVQAVTVVVCRLKNASNDCGSMVKYSSKMQSVLMVVPPFSCHFLVA